MCYCWCWETPNCTKHAGPVTQGMIVNKTITETYIYIIGQHALYCSCKVICWHVWPSQTTQTKQIFIYTYKPRNWANQMRNGLRLQFFKLKIKFKKKNEHEKPSSITIVCNKMKHRAIYVFQRAYCFWSGKCNCDLEKQKSKSIPLQLCSTTFW